VLGALQRTTLSSPEKKTHLFFTQGLQAFVTCFSRSTQKYQKHLQAALRKYLGDLVNASNSEKE